jgi:hypothetical protein
MARLRWWIGRLVLFMAALSIVCPAAAAEWRFAVVGDTRGASSTSPVNTAALSAIAQSMAGDGIDLVVVPGDLVYGSSTDLGSQLSIWRTTMAPLYNASIGVYPVRGNHETSGGVTAWRNAFPDLPQNGPTSPGNEQGLTYSVTHNNALFIGMDEYVTSHRVNQSWLDGVLAQQDRPPHVFVFGHEPAFSANHTDTLATYPTNRDLFWDSLGRAGVPMYFCGHDHFYARGAVADSSGNWVQQMIVGAGGAPFHVFSGYADARVQPRYSDDDHYGYLVVEIDDHAVSVQYKAQLNVAEPNVFTAVDTFDYVVPQAGDINADGHVDVADLVIVAASWGTISTDPTYNAAADLNSDDRIDVSDLLIMAGNWGE